MHRTASLTLLALAAAVAAEDAPTIIVTAERGESDLARAPVSVEVVEADDIRARGHVLNGVDWLRGLAGVNVLSRNGSIDGGLADIRIRGVDPVFTQFLVDGIPLNDPTSIGGDFNPSTINLSGVRRVEVLKGPQSGLYGSRSMGGVVQVMTARPTADPQAEARITAGSFRTRALDATVTGPVAGGIGYAVSVGGLASDGFSSTTSRQSGTPGDPGSFEDDAVHRSSLSARVEGPAGDAAGWYLAGLALRNHQEYDEQSPDDALPESKTSVDRVSAGGHVGGDALRLSVDAAYTDSERRLRTHFGPPPGYAADTSVYAGSEAYAQAKLEGRPFSGATLAVGLDGRREEAEQSYVDGAGRWSDRAGTVGIYGQAGYDLGRWTGSAVLRSEHHDAFGTAQTGRLAGACWLDPGALKIRGAVGNAFRAPSLYQLNGFEDFGYGYGYVGNPDLGPEKAVAYEVGVDGFVGEGLAASLTAFRTEYTDKIEYDDASAIGTYVNVGSDAVIQGVEGTLRVDAILDGPISLHLHGTLLSSDDGDGSDLPYVPHATGGARILLRQPVDGGAIRASVGYERSSGFATKLHGQEVISGFGLADAAIGLEFAGGWDVGFRVENLFDEKYIITKTTQPSPADYSTAPRSYYVDIGVRF